MRWPRFTFAVRSSHDCSFQSGLPFALQHSRQRAGCRAESRAHRRTHCRHTRRGSPGSGDKGYRVTLDDGWSAEFWFAKALKTETRDVPGALYPELTDGQFVGVVNFLRAMSDYRGQNIPAGTYTLRYQPLPQDGNHLGVAPNPDFLLAIPAANDSQPAQSYPFKKLIALSAKSTGTNHPAVIALESAAEPGTITRDERETVFSVAIPIAQGTVETLGIVLKGTGAQ